MSSAALEITTPQPVAQARLANFNRLARLYRWMEWFSFGPALWRARCTFLPQTLDRSSALVIGDGDGRFTAAMLARNARIQVQAIDASPAMLHQLVRRAGHHAHRVTGTLADARLPLELKQRFDLVVTHFFLDCLTTEEVELLASRIRRQLEPDAAWVISEFAIPQNLYGRLIAQPLVRALYFAFKLLTGLQVRCLPRYREALLKAGFVLVRERKRLFGLLVSEMWQPRAQSRRS